MRLVLVPCWIFLGSLFPSKPAQGACSTDSFITFLDVDTEGRSEPLTPCFYSSFCRHEQGPCVSSVLLKASVCGGLKLELILL